MVDVSAGVFASQPQPATQTNASVGLAASVAATAIVGGVVPQLTPPSVSVNPSPSSERTNVGEDDASRRGRGQGTNRTDEGATGAAQVDNLFRSGLRARVVLDFTSPTDGARAVTAVAAPRVVLEISPVDAVGGVASSSTTVELDQLTSFLERQFRTTAASVSPSVRVVS